MTELHRSLIMNMKLRRKELGISQMELAERVGVSAGFIGELEMGRKYPGPDTFLRIADALLVRPFRLIMSEEDLREAAGNASRETRISLAASFRERISRELDLLVEEQDPASYIVPQSLDKPQSS